MKDLLIGILITIALSVVVSICYGTEEPPKRKQGNVQVPTLVEIYPENTEVDTETETVILSPQTGGFWREKVMISVIHLIWIIPLAFMGGFITCITLD